MGSEPLLLLTGFEPFGGSSMNPSEQVAQRLDGKRCGGWQVRSAILPVEKLGGPQALLQALAEIQPQAVICLGEAGERPALSIERVAVNLLDYRLPDNRGVTVVDEPIQPGGPAAFFATLPVRELLDAVRKAGVPAVLSLSAGTFLCNQVMYVLLHHLAGQDGIIPAGFIHLPSLPEQASQTERVRPSMDVETALRGVRAAIEALPVP